jgi:hypothetical protein
MGNFVAVKEVAPNAVKSSSSVREIEGNFLLSLVVTQPAFGSQLLSSAMQIVFDCARPITIPKSKHMESP